MRHLDEINWAPVHRVKIRCSCLNRPWLFLGSILKKTKENHKSDNSYFDVAF